MAKYRVSYTRHDDRLFVGCEGVSFFSTELATAKFLGELEASYNIDQDSIVVHIFDDGRDS
jgi:hypothetical protein